MPTHTPTATVTSITTVLRLSVLCAGLGLFAGCGQRGPLFLPAPSPPQHPPAASETTYGVGVVPAAAASAAPAPAATTAAPDRHWEHAP